MGGAPYFFQYLGKKTTTNTPRKQAPAVPQKIQMRKIGSFYIITPIENSKFNKKGTLKQKQKPKRPAYPKNKNGARKKNKHKKEKINFLFFLSPNAFFFFKKKIANLQLMTLKKNQSPNLN